MYVNYGDVNFFECGRLVDSEHSDTEFDVLYCQPYDDEEDLYLFADCHVDIEDSWIDRKAVMAYIGMDNDEFDPIQFALGCIDYYGVEDFTGGYIEIRMKKAEICEILKHRLIANDNLNIEW